MRYRAEGYSVDALPFVKISNRKYKTISSFSSITRLGVGRKTPEKGKEGRSNEGGIGKGDILRIRPDVFAANFLGRLGYFDSPVASRRGGSNLEALYLAYLRT